MLVLFSRSAMIALRLWQRHALAIKMQNADIMPDPALLPLMTFLFPQVAAKVQAYARRMMGDAIS